ncbi:MAG: hypothetical protein QOG26_162 [Solirubrobacterales bacterium]|jgi:hypothetical protein|nr:hypothetical protein [Solirubrobacterales bacterium]
MIVLRKPYELLLGLLPDRLALAVRRSVWALARPALLALDRLRPARRRRNHLELLLVALGSASAVAALQSAEEEPAEVLVLTDSDDLVALRQAGCAVEYMPPAADFARHLPELDRGAYLERRLETIGRSYVFERVSVRGPAAPELEKALGTLARHARSESS